MQLVVTVGKTEYNFPHLRDIFDKCGKRTSLYTNDLAKLSAYWNDAGTPELTVRESPVLTLINVSMVIITTNQRMLKLCSCEIPKQLFNIGEEGLSGSLVNGHLVQWRDTVVRLLAFRETNQLGQLIINELEHLGYAGIFCDYTRVKEGNQLLLK